MRTEYYTDILSYADCYVTDVSETGSCPRLTRRTFYNRDGGAVYDQIFEGETEWYIFPDGRLCSKSEFIGLFVKRLNLTEEDIVLADRSAQFDFVQPLFQFGRKARFITVFHSGHFFEKEKIEWIIRSVVKAHEKNPEIYLDIYGRGEAGYTKRHRGS